MRQGDTTVRRRKVFYIPGYDPFPARRYRELYRRESAVQAEISGYALAMKGPLGGEGFGWQVETVTDGQTTLTDFEVLAWSDIVRDSQSRSVGAVYLALVQTIWTYLSTGALFRIMRLRKGPVIAALYPVGMLVLQAVLAVLLAICVLSAGLYVLDAAAESPGSPVWAYPVAGAPAAYAFMWLLRYFRNQDGRLYVYYLMQDFAYSASAGGAWPDALAKRMTAFEYQLRRALADDLDEVLIVGHSSGAHIAVSVLASVLRKHTERSDGPSISLLTLGHVIPMVSFLPGAERLRADLKQLSRSADVTWVDVTAPGDGCCFALCDPVAVSGQGAADARGPLVFSAAFSQSLSPERWRALRWRFFRLHFQYLCAFDRPRDYDYFQITAGPQTLHMRYRDRPASRSRIVHSVSGYTSVTP